MHSKVSVALATYNGERYIEEQLRSILQQSRPPDEIVISDDSSTDATLAIAARVLAASGVAYLLRTNKYSRGFSNNFQNALDHCSGDIVFLSDQDDSWHPTKVQTVLDAFDRNPRALLVLHDMEIGDAQLRPRHSTYLQELDALGMGRENYCSGCAMALKRELLELLLPFPGELTDHDIWINEFAKAIGRRVVVADRLTIYRRHGANLTTNQIFTRNLLTRIGSEIKDERRGTFLRRQFLINSELLARIPGSGFLHDAGETSTKLEELRRAIDYSGFRIRAKSLPLGERIRFVLGNREKYLPRPVHLAKDIVLPFYR